MTTFVFVYLAASVAMVAFLTWIGTVHESNKQARSQEAERAGFVEGGERFHGSAE